MSRFKKLSHVIYCCKYHLVWVPKYRYKVLVGAIGSDVYRLIVIHCEKLSCEIIEINIQRDHCHLLVVIPPKLSTISKLMGIMKPSPQQATGYRVEFKMAIA